MKNRRYFRVFFFEIRFPRSLPFLKIKKRPKAVCTTAINPMLQLAILHRVTTHQHLEKIATGELFEMPYCASAAFLSCSARAMRTSLGMRTFLST